MKKCENCGKPIIFKTYVVELYKEKYNVCKNCYNLVEEFKKRHS